MPFSLRPSRLEYRLFPTRGCKKKEEERLREPPALLVTSVVPHEGLWGVENLVVRGFSGSMCSKMGWL